jgi:hypothetical protein
MIPSRFAACVTGCLLLWGPSALVAQDDDPPRLPIGQAGVDYLSPAKSDPLARLIADVEAGRKTIAHDDSTGYLPALLDALDVPVESQLLLFSRTSLQARHIGPKTPRAIYFTDEVTIGWIPDAPIIEVMAQDPAKGSRIQRREACSIRSHKRPTAFNLAASRSAAMAATSPSGRRGCRGSSFGALRPTPAAAR